MKNSFSSRKPLFKINIESFKNNSKFDKSKPHSVRKIKEKLSPN